MFSVRYGLRMKKYIFQNFNYLQFIAISVISSEIISHLLAYCEASAEQITSLGFTLQENKLPTKNPIT
jgi:hypothetical protein